MKIGIDASRYTHEQATGVEWYSWHIINGIIQEVCADEEMVSGLAAGRACWLGHSHAKDGHSAIAPCLEIVLYSKEPISLPPGQACLIACENISNKILKAKRFWTLLHLSKEIMKNPPDVLFIPSHTLPLRFPKKTVITIHDVAFRREKKAYSFFQYHHLNWSTKFAVKHASKIIVPSETTKNDLIELFNCPAEKIVVIPHGFSAPKEIDDSLLGVSEIFKYFKITKELPYILFVGRLENKKNLARLVSAFKQFSANHPDFKLILAGKRGVGFKEVLKAVNNLGLIDKVIMPGYITEDEKFLLYKYCRIFAFPSLYEGFGLPVLEAFYHKKPVLCSKIPTLMEVCRDAAKYVDPLNVDEISNGLELLISDKSLADNLILKGIERLKNFSWENSSKKTIVVLLTQNSTCLASPLDSLVESYKKRVK